MSKLRLILLLSSLLLAACDESDCIMADDFGNLVTKSIILPSNPFDSDGDLKDAPANSAGYIASEKDCSSFGFGTISDSSKAYSWLDTGVNIVSTSNILHISVKGQANSCALSITEDENGVPSTDSGEDCEEAINILSSEYSSYSENEGYQPSVNYPSCSIVGNDTSTYYVNGHSDFSIIVPRPTEDIKTSAEIETLLATAKSGTDYNIELTDAQLKSQIEKQNSHSLSGTYDPYDYVITTSYKNNIASESSSDRSWYKNGNGIYVAVIDNSQDIQAGPWQLTDTSYFTHNGAPPTGVTYTQTTCSNDSSRYYYSITANDSDIEIDSDLYDFCEQDVYTYKGTAVSGYLKFKINETYTGQNYCSNSDADYHGDRPFDLGDSVLGCDTGADYNNGDGCWEKRNTSGCVISAICAKCWDWKGDDTAYSSYSDNFGSYNLTIKSGYNCLSGPEAVEFRIGDDETDNRKIITPSASTPSSASFDATPWNTGALYVRAMDKKIVEETNQECSSTWLSNGSIDTATIKGLYDNNVGNYEVKIRTLKEVAVIANIKGIMEDLFGNVFSEGFREIFFENLVGTDSVFQNILRIGMTLSIVMISIAFLVGVTNITQTTLFNLVVRMALIWMFTSPTSWYWFSQMTYFFESGAEDLSNLLTGSFIEKPSGEVVGSVYGMLDQMLYIFFQPEIYQKWASVFFSPIIVGVILFFMIGYSMYLMFYSIGKSLLEYFLIRIIFSLLFMLGPIFMGLLLFEKTKDMFGKWLGLVTSYAMQLLLLYLVISIFAALLLNVFYDLFSFGICWKPVWVIEIPNLVDEAHPISFEFFSFWHFYGYDPKYSESYNLSNGPDFLSCLFFLVLAYAFKGVLEQASQLGDRLSGGQAGSGDDNGGIVGGKLLANSGAGKAAYDFAGKAFDNLKNNFAKPLAGRLLYGAFGAGKALIGSNGLGSLGKAIGKATNAQGRQELRAGISSAKESLKSLASTPSKIKASFESGNVRSDLKRLALRGKDALTNATSGKIDDFNKNYAAAVRGLPNNRFDQYIENALTRSKLKTSESALINKNRQIANRAIEDAKRRGLSEAEQKKYALNVLDRLGNKGNNNGKALQVIKDSLSGNTRESISGVKENRGILSKISPTSTNPLGQISASKAHSLIQKNEAARKQNQGKIESYREKFDAAMKRAAEAKITGDNKAWQKAKREADFYKREIKNHLGKNAKLEKDNLRLRSDAVLAKANEREITEKNPITKLKAEVSELEAARATGLKKLENDLASFNKKLAENDENLTLLSNKRIEEIRDRNQDEAQRIKDEYDEKLEWRKEAINKGSSYKYDDDEKGKRDIAELRKIEERTSLDRLSGVSESEEKYDRYDEDYKKAVEDPKGYQEDVAKEMQEIDKEMSEKFKQLDEEFSGGSSESSKLSAKEEDDDEMNDLEDELDLSKDDDGEASDKEKDDDSSNNPKDKNSAKEEDDDSLDDTEKKTKNNEEMIEQIRKNNAKARLKDDLSKKMNKKSSLEAKLANADENEAKSIEAELKQMESEISEITKEIED